MTGYRAIADYYDAEYESLEMLQHDVPLFLQQLPRRSLKILDLATGTGRSAIPLAQAGHRVVGVDYDPTCWHWPDASATVSRWMIDRCAWCAATSCA